MNVQAMAIKNGNTRLLICSISFLLTLAVLMST